jgi:hypothetical protein
VTVAVHSERRRRPVAAIAARRAAKARRLALELAPRLELLDDEWLEALLEVIAAELESRKS